MDIKDAPIVIDVRQKYIKKSPYTCPAMSHGQEGKYVITGFFSTIAKRTSSKCARRTVFMEEGQIIYQVNKKYVYYELPYGTKIVSMCT